MSPAAALTALLGAACAFASPARVAFKSADGVALVADYRAPDKGKPVLVLLHGAESARGEWAPFSARLRALGWGTLALDGRGHGESGGGRVSAAWRAEDWLKLSEDIEAAVRFLAARKIPPARAALGGASIGANLALAAAARLPETPFVVLLSPGLNYRGVGAAEPLARLACPVLIAAAADDPYALESARTLIGLAKNHASLRLEAGSGHGVRMLEGPENAAFVKGLTDWLRARTAR